MTPPIPPRPGPGALAARTAAMLRVDHAGELAAVAIYRGQKTVMAARPEAAAAFERLEAAERQHLERFERLILEARSRPSFLVPLWRAAGFALGAATALIGEAAAHACTEAVETVIEDHYEAQIAELEGQAPALAAELARFRADEAAHRAEALASGAQSAPAHALLTRAIAAGCRAAIAVAERV